MAELQHERVVEASTPGTAATPSGSHAAAQMVHTMLARGIRTARDYAAVLAANLGAQPQILALLHATLGNAFVREVLDAQGETAAPAAAALGPVRVTARALRVRQEPSTASAANVIGRLTRGTVVTPLAREGRWLRIDHNGASAYIHASYVEPAAPAAAGLPAAHEPASPIGDEDAGGDTPAEPAPSVPALPATTEPAATTAAAPAAATTAATPAAPAVELAGTYTGMFSKVYDTGDQKVQVFVSPGGLTRTPNVFLHFHGYYADYGIDPELAWDRKSEGHDKPQRTSRSGIDQAKEAMRLAQDKNTIAILPQGVLGKKSLVAGDKSHEGGFMDDLVAQGLPTFLQNVLGPLAADLGLAALSPGNIALSGHSAGGYQGVHAAMAKAGALADAITDVTLMDASYSALHLDDTQRWMVRGKPGKTVRIVNSWYQQMKDKKAMQRWQSKFGPDALAELAAAHEMTVKHVGDVGEKPDADTRVMQHAQLITKDGAVQCDVLVTMFSIRSGRDHDPLRDRLLDDAMLSIGEGAAGNERFGYHDRGRLTGEAAHADEPTASAAEPAAASSTVDPEVHTLPAPEHVDGDTAAPEPVKPPKAAPKAAKKQQRKMDPEEAALREELYGEGGSIRAEKLGRHTRVKTKDKKWVDVNLTDAQYDFKQRVYRAAVDRIGKGKLFGGVADDELRPFEGERVRAEVVGPLTRMLTAMRAEGLTVWVGSGYRDPVEDFRIWDDAFDRIYLWDTQDEREKRWPDEPFGEEAVKYTVKQIAKRKAPPGSSNHSNGIAIDLHIKVNGREVPTSFSNQKAWHASPHKRWLDAHAGEYGFKNYKAEAWHWDYRG